MATGSSNLLKYVHEHVLECSICTEQFKNPKSLPCLHIFCHNCIDEHIRKSAKGDQYKCPICNEQHILPPEGTSSLRDAFLQKSLIEVTNLMQKKRIACTSCNDGNDAHCACAQCGEFLCDDCTIVHKKHRMTKHHNSIPIPELVDMNKLADFQKRRFENCSEHEGELCKLYCNKDELHVCYLCTYDLKHKGHQFITLEAKFQELKPQIDDIKRSLNGLIKVSKRELQHIAETTDEIRRKETEALQDIEKRVRSFEETVKRYKAGAIYKIRNMSAREIESLESLTKKLLSNIDRCDKRADEIGLMDSLPIPSAIQVANNVIKANQTCPVINPKRDPVSRMLLFFKTTEGFPAE